MPGSQLTQRLFEQVETKSPLCDVTLNCQDGKVLAHKSVLAAASSVFEAMLTSCFVEAKSGEVKVDLNCDVTYQALEFLYTGMLKTDSSSVWDLLEYAHQYQLDELIGACTDFIKMSKISKETCFKQFTYGLMYDVNDLVESGIRSMCDNLVEASKTEHFGELEYEQIIRILLSNLGSDAENLEATLNWILYDSETRYQMHYRDTLDFIHLNRIEDDRFFAFQAHDFFKEREEDWEHLMKRREWYAGQRKRRHS